MIYFLDENPVKAAQLNTFTTVNLSLCTTLKILDVLYTSLTLDTWWMYRDLQPIHNWLCQSSAHVEWLAWYGKALYEIYDANPIFKANAQAWGIHYDDPHSTFDNYWFTPGSRHYDLCNIWLEEAKLHFPISKAITPNDCLLARQVHIFEAYIIYKNSEKTFSDLVRYFNTSYPIMLSHLKIDYVK